MMDHIRPAFSEPRPRFTRALMLQAGLRALLVLGAAVTLAKSAGAQVTYEDIVKGPGDNWLTNAGDYKGQRHSLLKKITPANAGSLVPKWVYHVPKASG